LDTEDLPFSPPISLPSHRLVPLLGLLPLLVRMSLPALLPLLVLHLPPALLPLLVHLLLELRLLAIPCRPSSLQLKRPYVPWFWFSDL
jgi:hypothetical protein